MIEAREPVFPLNAPGGADGAMSRRSVLSLGALLGLAACAPKGLGSAAGARFDWTLSTPEAAGMSQAGVEGIRAALQKQIDDGVINGVVSAVARHNELVWYEAQGFNNPNAKTPMRKDAIFRVMSSTKPVTALAVLALVEQGKLSLDDKVSKYIPSFSDPKVAIAPPGTTDPAKVQLVPAAREIVIRDLLTHTSGITSVGDKMSPGIAKLVNTIERRPEDTLATYIPRLGDAVLEFHPGTRFAYSPLDALDTALYIVQLVSGVPADVFLRERLFRPLGMVDTYFNVPAEKQSRIVDILAGDDGEWKAANHLLGPGPYQLISGGGGLFSTVHDFMNLELMLLNQGLFNGQRILRPETVSLMSQNYVGNLFAEWIPPMTHGQGFGLAVRIVESPDSISARSVGSYGWGGAYGTDSWVDPSLDLAAVIFLQMNPAPLGASRDFENAIRAAVVR